MSTLATHHALIEALAVAVPLRILELAALPDDTRARRITIWAHDAATAIGSGSDALIFGSKTSGAPAKIFNTLAKGLAAASYAPSGITFGGRHWTATDYTTPNQKPTTLPETDVSLGTKTSTHPTTTREHQ